MKIPIPIRIDGNEASSKTQTLRAGSVPIKNEISLYFHIPFCTKKCPYCHFYVLKNRLDLHEALTRQIDQEWERATPKLVRHRVVSIYFGGGTPTLYGPEAIGRLIQKAKPWMAQDCEITIEANPEMTSVESYLAFRKVGINRLSLGVQSLDNDLLKILGRTHSAQQAEEALFAARAAGFMNVSIDLMTEIPNQTEESMQRTFDSLSFLPISHVSLYNLTFEANTPFARRAATLKPKVPNQTIALKLLDISIHALDKLGLTRYEISAFGRPSVHNLGYWTGRPFLGFGPSAFSYWGGERFRNGPLPQGGIDFQETLPYPANFRELLAIRLRLFKGVELSSFGLPVPEEVIPILFSLKDKGLLSQEGSSWCLTNQGRLFYDSVAEEII